MEPRSASDNSLCAACGTPIPGAGPACSGCGALREVPDGEDFFRTLGVERGLDVDAEALRDRFYALSKQTHPDRFVQAAPAQALRAARWTTLLNRAYQTLRDPDRRARYLLETAGLGETEKKAAIPFDLAETYFELQDLLGEPEGAAKLVAFQKQLQSEWEATAAAWERLAREWRGDKKTDESASLRSLAQLLVKRKYLASMLADIDRKKGVRE